MALFDELLARSASEPQAGRSAMPSQRDLARIRGVALDESQQKVLSSVSNGDPEKESFLRTVLAVENRGFGRPRDDAVSPAGAAGAFQFVPATAQAYGLDPEQRGDFGASAEAAARYYDDLSRRYGGNRRAMLADYNGGPRQARAVLEGRTPVRETAEYLALAEALQGDASPPPRQAVPLNAPAPTGDPEFQPIDIERGRRAARAYLGSPTSKEDDTPPVSGLFAELLTRDLPAAKEDKGWALPVLKSGVGQVGTMGAGLLEYVADQIAGDQSTPEEQSVGTLATAFRNWRQSSQQFSADALNELSPEDRALHDSEWTTLDADKSIFRKGVGGFVKALSMQALEAAPSSLVTLVPGTIMIRAGLRGALFLGASEGAMSVGAITAGLKTEIEQAPEQELMQSARYQQLRQTMGETEARNRLAVEAEGVAPLVGGVVVGVIGRMAGKYIDPKFTDIPAGIGGRFRRGFLSEAGQEASQSGVEQAAQNIAAQIYDTGRSVWEGVPEQTVQGGIVGGLIGGVTTAAIGPRRTALPTTEPGTNEAPPEEPPPDTVPPDIRAALESSLTAQPTAEATPPWAQAQAPSGQLDAFGGQGQAMGPSPMQDVPPFRPAEVTTPANPAVVEEAQRRTGLGRMSMSELDAASREETPPRKKRESKKAYEARVAATAKRISDEVAAQGRRLRDDFSRQAPNAAGVSDPRELALRQDQFQFGYTDPPPPPPPPPGTGFTLVPPKGQGELPLQKGRMRGRVPAAAPPAPDMSQPAAYSNERLPGGDSEREARYAGTAIDPNQQDIFGDMPPPSPGAAPPAETMWVAEVRDAPGGKVLKQELFDTPEEANDWADKVAVSTDYAVTVGRETSRPAPPAAPAPVETRDEPSAEPIRDLKAQMQDLKDGLRYAVYLSRDNLRMLRKRRMFDQVSSSGVPLANFDGKGGTLIARDRSIAEQLLRARDSGQSIQKVLGMATGAGFGKPAGANIAVQQRNADDAVTRESLVATPEEAQKLAALWQKNGRKAVILSADEAIARRNALIAEEETLPGKQKLESRRRYARHDAYFNILQKINKEFENDQYTAEKVIDTVGLSEEKYSTSSPNVVARRLVGYARGIAKRNPETAKRVLKVARELSPDVEKEVLKNPFLKPAAEERLPPFRGLTSDEIASLEGDTLDKVFRQAVSYIAGRRVKRVRDQRWFRGDTAEVSTLTAEQSAAQNAPQKVVKSRFEADPEKAAKEVRALMSETGAVEGEGEFDVASAPLARTYAIYKRPSDKQRFIRRASAVLNKASQPGSKNLKLTRTAVLQGGQEDAPRRSGFYDASPLVSDELSINQTEENAERRQARRERTEQVRTALQTQIAQTSLFMEALSGERYASWGSSEMVYAKGYARSLYMYAKALLKVSERAGDRSSKWEEEARKITEDLQSFEKLPPKEFAAQVGKLMRAESREQAFRTSRGDMARLGVLRDSEHRVKTILKVNQSIAAAANMKESWKEDNDANTVVAPFIHRLVSYMYHDMPLGRDAKAYEPRQQVKFFFHDGPFNDSPSGEVELYKVRSALDRMKAKNYDNLYLPAKRMLEGLGFKFANDKLIVERESRKNKKGVSKSRVRWPQEVLLVRRYNARYGKDATGVEREGVASIDVQRAIASGEQRERDALTKGVLDLRMKDPSLSEADAMRKVAERRTEQRLNAAENPSPAVIDRMVQTRIVNDALDTLNAELSGGMVAKQSILKAEKRLIDTLEQAQLWDSDTDEIVLPAQEVKDFVASKRARIAVLQEELRKGDIRPEKAQRRGADKKRFAKQQELARATQIVQNYDAGLEVVPKERRIPFQRVSERLLKKEISYSDARRLLLEQARSMKVPYSEANAAAFKGTVDARVSSFQKQMANPEKLVEQRVPNAPSSDEPGSDATVQILHDLHDFKSETSKQMHYAGVNLFAQVASMKETESKSLQDLLLSIRASMDNQNKYTGLIDALIALDMKVPVSPFRGGTLGKYLDSNHILLNYDLNLFGTRWNNDERVRYANFVQTLLHEAVHAASVATIRNNPELRAVIRQLMMEVTRAGTGVPKVLNSIRQSLKGESPPLLGFKNELEFIAEAFTNPVFQNYLKSIKFSPKQPSLWHMFVRWVQQALKYVNNKFLADYSAGMELSVLDAVLSLQDSVLTGERGESVGRSYDRDVIDTLTQNKFVRENLSSVGGLRHKGRKFGLMVMTLDQINSTYGDAFERVKNGIRNSPLNDYFSAFSRRNADTSAMMESSDKIMRKWVTAIEKLGGDAGKRLSQLMYDATLHGVHPDLPLSDPQNEHIKSDEKKKRHAELQARYNAMKRASPEMAQLYTQVRDDLRNSLVRETNLVTLNALRAFLTTGQGAAMSLETSNNKVNENNIVEKKLNTKDGLRAAFTEAQLSDTAIKDIVRLARVPMQVQGPYFPFTRYGDYAVAASRLKEVKTFSTAEEAAAYAAKLKDQDPTLEVRRVGDDKSSVEVREKELRLAETYTEAEENRREMAAQYGAENVSKEVQLRSQLFNRGSVIASESGLGRILDKLGDNDAAKAAIKEFYIRSLSDSSFRKHEANRKKRRGVNPETMQRAYATYAKAAAYYTAQLRHGWKMAQARQGMAELAEGISTGTTELNDVAREIAMRDAMMTSTEEVSKWVRRGSDLSHFMLLTSPSYWIVNATQPYMVTLPWLSARYGYGKSAAALSRAQKLILHPLVGEAVSSAGGLKALWSKVDAERAFSVIEQLTDPETGYLVKKLGKEEAKPYLDLLNTLRRDSIIDLSFVAELREIADDTDNSIVRRVLDASRIMAHLTEVNNRVITAIAAYDLAKAKGLDHETSIALSKRAVSTTQFNYSAGNKPRLFHHKGPLGSFGPLAFQFMQYVQHMYAMMISEVRKMTSGNPIARKEGFRTLAGLISTHATMGGLIGASIQPLKWAIGALIMGLNDDDDRLQDVLSGELYERKVREVGAELFGKRMGLLLSRGLPAALGTDLSSRMSLGTLYMIDLKPETADSMLASLVKSFGGPIPGLAVNQYKAMQYFMDGEYKKAVENSIPVPKGAKDVLRFLRYAEEGLTLPTGERIMKPDEIPATELFLQSLGFSPTTVSEQYAARGAVSAKKQTVRDQHDRLMRHFRNARTPQERAEVRKDVAAFNRKHPEARITVSSLMRSLQNAQEGERFKKFGVDMRRKERVYATEAEPYLLDEGDEE